MVGWFFFIKFSAGIKLKAFHFGSLRATQDSFLRILSRRQQNNPNAHQKRCLRGRVIDKSNNDSAIQPVSWSDATKPTSQSAAVLPVQQRSRSSGNNVIILLFISVAVCNEFDSMCILLSSLSKSRRVVGEMLKYVIAASSRALFAMLRLGGGAQLDEKR